MPTNIVNIPSLTAVIHAAVKSAPSRLDLHTMSDLIGKPYTTLMCELSRQQGHKLGADMVLPLTLLSGSDAPLHFLAREAGGVFIRLPEAAETSADLICSLAESVREFGEYAAETARDFSDGDVTVEQLTRIEKEGDEAIEAILRVKKMARATHERQYGKR